MYQEILLNESYGSIFEFAWNDIYCLAALLLSMTFVVCLIYQHFDLRLRMLGAHMRIACCSLIYRKVRRESGVESP